VIVRERVDCKEHVESSVRDSVSCMDTVIGDNVLLCVDRIAADAETVRCRVLDRAAEDATVRL
jgi:hypothetical protein